MSTQHDHYNQGLTLYGQGNHADAVAEYDKALALDPNNGEIHMAKSMAWQQLKEYENALEAAKRAVQLEPREPLMYTNLSRVFVKLGMIPEAEDAMAMANRLSSGLR